METVKPVFHWADYLVFVAMLMSSVSIGVFYAIRSRKQNSTGEYMLASREMGFFPVSMSLLASLFTGVYIQGTVSEIYFRGAVFLTFSIVPLIGVGVISGMFIMPKFYELKLKSVYQYLDYRFNVVVRNCCLLLGYIYLILHSGIATYAASLVLTTVTGGQLSVLSAAVILSAVCTFYTVIGGIKAVLWADCFQMGLIFVSLLAAVIQAFTKLGLSEIWRINLEGKRIDVFNFNPDPREFSTFWVATIGGFFAWMPSMTILQYQVQRYATCKTQKTAHISFSLFIAGCVAISVLCILAGAAIYALYVDCDPFSTGALVASDGLLPYYILDRFQHLPGIPGLLVSGLCGAALSTTSSILNSIATITGEHVVTKIWKDLPDSRYLMITKLLAFFFGALNIGTTVLVAQLRNLLPAIVGIIGVTNGPVCAVFILGIFFRRANAKGTLVGFVAGTVLAMWMFIGSIFHQPPPASLDLSTEGCGVNESVDATTSYSTNASVITDSSMMTTDVTNTTMLPPNSSRPFFIELYMVSRYWYPMVSIVSVVVVGLIASLACDAVFGKGDVDSTLLCNGRKTCCCCLTTSEEGDQKSRLFSDNDDNKTVHDVDVDGDKKNGSPQGILNPAMDDDISFTTHF